VPVLPSCLIDPIWDQVATLLPPHQVTHPLRCHRPRTPDRVVFDTLVQVLVFGCAYARIADDTCSATTRRRRRDEWIAAGVRDTLYTLVLAADDRMIGLELDELAVAGGMTTAPCGGEVAGRSPVNRGKQGRTRSLVVDATGPADGQPALGGRAHACVDQCVHEACLVYGAPGRRRRVLARLLRGHHHCPSAHARRGDPLPLGGTTIPETVIEHPIGASS